MAAHNRGVRALGVLPRNSTKPRAPNTVVASVVSNRLISKYASTACLIVSENGVTGPKTVLGAGRFLDQIQPWMYHDARASTPAHR
jgi:hypothetical protein